jgi:hypothetical protein
MNSQQRRFPSQVAHDQREGGVDLRIPIRIPLEAAALNMPHLVGMRAVATRQSMPISAVAFMYASSFG